MKKPTTTAVRLLIVAIAFSAGLTVKSAQLNGSITFSGGVQLDAGTVATATKVTGWLDQNGISPAVVSSSGDFAGLNGSIATFAAPWNFNSGPIPTFWQVGGFAFDLTVSSIVSQNASFVNVSAPGFISGNGFDPTPGTFFFTAQSPPAGVVFSFSAANPATPEPCDCGLVCAANKSAECDEAWTFDPPTRTGTCSNTPFSNITTVTNSAACGYVATRTWELVDSCNNTAKCSQVVTVRDTTKPTITTCPTGSNLGCNPTSTPTCDTVKALVVANDNCHVKQINCTVEDSDSGCNHTRKFTIRAEDDCGNLSDPCVVTYIWTIDTTKPAFISVPPGGDLGCNPDLQSIPTDASMAALVQTSDACSKVNVVVTHVDTVTSCDTTNRTFTISANDTCFNTNITTVTYTWGCGVNTCIPGTFTFTGSSSDKGTAGNVRTFTANGVSVKVTAFSRTKDTATWATAWLGLFSGGLGVTDSSESGDDPTHSVDNVGRDNYLLFEFSQPVVVSRVCLGWVSNDSDLTAWIGTVTDPYNNHQTLSDALLTGFGTPEENTGGSSTRCGDINAAQTVGNVLVVAASTKNADKSKDQFKLNKIVFCKPDCSPPPPPVCTSGQFTFSGSSANTGSPNTRTFMANNGVMVKVTGFSRTKTSGTWNPEYVGLYSKGLGVTDSTEDGSDPTHTLDNVGRDNYLLFEFSQKVVLDKIYLGFVDTDSDVTVWIGTKSDPFNNHIILDDSVLSGFGAPEENLGSSSTRWADVNAGQVVGNVVVVAASVANADGKKDQVKVNLMAFCTPDPLPTLPSPWKTKDIGSVGAAGGANYYSVPKQFNVLGSGDDIWSSDDEFRYVYQSASGDCSIVARVSSLQNSHPWAKAGVMIRESTSDDAREVSVLLTPANGVVFQVRSSSGGSTSFAATAAGVSAPQWLRLTRTYGTGSFKAEYSNDGSSWTVLGTRTVSMSSSVYIGLAVTSHNDGTTTLATFDNVTVVP